MVTYLRWSSCDNGREPGQSDPGKKLHGSWDVTMSLDDEKTPQHLQVTWS